jgi:hypothetical protein
MASGKKVRSKSQDLAATKSSPLNRQQTETNRRKSEGADKYRKRGRPKQRMRVIESDDDSEESQDERDQPKRTNLPSNLLLTKLSSSNASLARCIPSNADSTMYELAKEKSEV